MSEIVEKIKTDLKKSLDKIYANKLKRLILFGSYARGDARSDSDMDFLVVLDIKDSELNVYDEISRMNDEVYDLVLKHEVTISVVPVSEEKYQYSIMPFIVNARKEGIAAWMNSITLNKIYEMRQSSDYDFTDFTTGDEAIEVLNTGKDFVQTILEYVKSNPGQSK